VCCVLRAACCVRAVRCKIRGRFVRNRFALQRQTDRQLVECCTCICALAAALVMAGTGDVPLLRTLRALRGRVDQDVQYGHHMAVASAIGFLFLGGGRATLSTSNEAIAALVISLFPRFPASTSDCRYHLQACPPCRGPLLGSSRADPPLTKK